MFKKILVATDLSPASDVVLGCLGELRALGVEKVLLLHCLGIRHLEEMKHLYLPMAEPKIQEQKAVLAKLGFSVEAEISSGLPKFEINRMAKEKDCSLIVVGTSGHTMTDEIGLSGVASEVIHQAVKPVLLVRVKMSVARDRERCKMKCGRIFDHILFPTDFSDNADHAFSQVRKLVKKGVKRVTLMHVQDKVRIGKHLNRKLEEFNQIDDERLGRLKSALTKEGPAKVELHMPYGSSISEILKTASGGQVTLVVMGSQGRGLIREILLGSVSHNVARHAPVSVLLIPAVR